MDAAASTNTKKASKRATNRVKAAPGDVTLGELAKRFIAHLEQAGKSRGTTFSYGMDLQIAKAALGADTPVASITPERVREYFESAAVTKTRKGRSKALPTILKTRRVLRLALTWAAERKLIEAAPLPATEKAEAVSTTSAPATEQA